MPHAAGGQTIRSTCSPAPSTMLDLSVPADRIRSTSVRPSSTAISSCGFSVAASRSRSPMVALPAAQRSGRLDAHHARHVAQARDQPADHLVRLVQQHARDLLLEPGDAGQDVLLGPLGEALDAAQLPVSRRGPQRVDRVDAALLVQQLDRARPDAGDLQDLQQAVRHLRTQLVVVRQAAGLRQLRQLLGERRAGAGQLGRRAAPVQRRNVLRVALDGIGHPAVGDRLVDHLAHDLEHVADLAEDTRQLEVGQQGIVGARHRARSGHRRQF